MYDAAKGISLSRLLARSLAEERGIPIVFVIIPAREQVHPERYDFSQYPSMAGHELEKPQRILRRHLEDQGLTSLDLLPTIRDASGEEALYYELDQHWNRRGHEVAGKAIADFLVERGLARSPRR